MNHSEVQKRYGMKKGITEQTAWNWLRKLGYQYTLEPTGQYVNGHEHKDVDAYRNHVFLPCWKELEPTLWIWTLDGKSKDTTAGDLDTQPYNKKIVVWFHDKSTFYANDHHKKWWCHVMETAAPKPKGEGLSLMVAHFVSADYGWLQSPDGKETACVHFKAGKNREGYFTNENILEQTQTAMDLANKLYPDDKHVFIFDNTTTHMKRPATAVSACNMTKNPSQTFGVQVTVFENGKIWYTPDGKVRKWKVQMAAGKYTDGSLQEFYEDVFIGMTKILQQWGLTEEAKLNMTCKNFKCAPEATVCCQHHVLYNQPDWLGFS